MQAIPSGAIIAAYRPVTRGHIRGYLEKTNPHAPAEPFSDDIWALGTAAWLYELMCVPIPYQDPDGHSGPGTGGLTTALFIDWADFTNDRAVLEEVCWPVVRGGWEIDCEWEDAKPVRVTLRPGPHAGPRPLVRFNGRPWRFQ